MTSGATASVPAGLFSSDPAINAAIVAALIAQNRTGTGAQR